MTGLAIGLVLFSAFLHATWNFLAKRANGGPPLVWLFDALTVLIFAPVILVSLFFIPFALSWDALLFMTVSAALHLAYFILLQKGYKVGDLSLVYPLARGTGPVLSTSVAILVLGERPGFIAIVGAFLVAGSVFFLTGGPHKLTGKSSRWAVGFGLITGVFIAGYTLWDKQAVSLYNLTPLFFYYGSVVIRVLLLSPYAWRVRTKIAFEWKHHKIEASGIAVMSTVSYFLVLSVLVFTPVSYVAPFREISILIGSIFGLRLLSESEAKRRLPAASLMVIGVMALALG